MRRLAVVLLVLGRALAVPPPDALPAATLATLRQVIDSPDLNGGQAGALVIAVGRHGDGFQPIPYDGGAVRELFAWQADRLFTPASNLKLFTVAAALETLGPDKVLTTRVVAAAAPAGGAVDRLYLVGGGDPSLNRDDLKALAKAVRDRGITRVGTVLGDSSRYRDPVGDGWSVDDLPWYYAAEAAALTLDRNQVDVFVAPTRPGEPARAWLDPPTRYLTIDSTVTTGPAGSATAVDFSRDVSRRAIVLRGSIAADRKTAPTEGLAIPDPPAYAAAEFRQALADAGVDVTGAAGTGTAPKGAVELARHASAHLSALCRRLLKSSDNLYAELVLRELGVATAGSGTAAGGVHGVRAWLRDHGLDPARTRLVDGSGLSRYNLVSPRTIAGVLRTMLGSPCRDVYFDDLPLAGRDGTIKYRMRGTAAEANVRAKTGSVNSVTALSGTLTTRDGDVLVVATLFNHSLSDPATLRRLHDRFFVALAESRR